MFQSSKTPKICGTSYFDAKHQEVILRNQLNDIIVANHGQAESITPEEIEGTFQIATVHTVLPRIFFLTGNKYLVHVFPHPSTALSWEDNTNVWFCGGGVCGSGRQPHL